MADITCTHKDADGSICGVKILDPCQKINVLMGMKMELQLQQAHDADTLSIQNKIDSINQLLTDVVGLNKDEHDKIFSAFANNNQQFALIAKVRNFSLKCIKGHREQYSITCD